MEYDIEIDEFRSKYYHKKGTNLLHREGGPAVEHANGDEEWWINEQRHRENGPAVIWCKNWVYDNEWWVDGIQLSPEKEDVLNKWWHNKNGI